MTEPVDEQARIVSVVVGVISTWFEGQDPAAVERCSAEVVGRVRSMILEPQKTVRISSAGASPTSTALTSVRGWRRHIPAAFLLVAWYVAWLLLFGLDRRTWLTSAEIALAATVAFAVVVRVWSWLERSFGA